MSSDGGFSAPSTAPTFAAGSAASANSDVSNAVFAMPAPIQNGALGSPGTDNSSDGLENPFAAETATEAKGPGGDDTAGASGFAAIVAQTWGMGKTPTGITE